MLYVNRKFPDFRWLYLVVLAFKYIVVPFIFLWCINTLFSLDNTITFWTWLASLLFLLIVKFMVNGFKVPESSFCNECSQRDECEYSSYYNEDDDKEEVKNKKAKIVIMSEEDIKPNYFHQRSKKRRK